MHFPFLNNAAKLVAKIEQHFIEELAQRIFVIQSKTSSRISWFMWVPHLVREMSQDFECKFEYVYVSYPINLSREYISHSIHKLGFDRENK